MSQTNSNLSYSTLELQSYLPAGWNLESADGEYEAGRERWRISIQDVSELVSTLAVNQQDADRLGRIPALRAAIDRLVRKL